MEFNRSCPLFLASFGKLRLSDQVQFIPWHGIQQQIIWIFCRESEVQCLSQELKVVRHISHQAEKGETSHQAENGDQATWKEH